MYVFTRSSFTVNSLESIPLRMTPKQKVPEKIRPTASHRKRLIEEREDPSHLNFNQLPRVPAKRIRTDSTRAEESESAPQVAVTPEEVQDIESPSTSRGDSTTDEEGILDDNNDDSSESEADEYGPRDTSLLTSFQTHRAKALALGQDPRCLRVFYHSHTWDIGKEVEKVQSLVELQELGKIGAISYTHYNATLIITFAERWHLETNSFYFKWGEITIMLEDVWRLIGLRVGGDMTVVQGKWGATNVKQVFRDYFDQNNQVYLDLKAGGVGISLSLVKMVDFFAYKVGINAAGEASSSFELLRLSSRAVAKAYMLYVLGSFLFTTKKGTTASPKYSNFFESKNSNITWSWGAATLAYLYYNLGASSRVNAKVLACCTTFLESWIFEHFLKLLGILKPNNSRAPEYCTRWSWSRTTSDRSGEKALKIFREALDNYKLEDDTAVNLDGNDDRRKLGDGGAVGGSVGSLVGGADGGGIGGSLSQREHVQGQNKDIISRLEEEISI
ncbi:hypothetical protein GIB67_009133 [Kingdonia uniflora]|uniref:Aminotransferase-like plant mobile domain-containing protein n=1 Tax=Kingdonia uniflora TaxID=39325 RepID=A0A7J7N293_9MAGN|nr:hypothetical protein GIB67_009133 [Kingdonia uniflora]